MRQWLIDCLRRWHATPAPQTLRECIGATGSGQRSTQQLCCPIRVSFNAYLAACLSACHLSAVVNFLQSCAIQATSFPNHHSNALLRFCVCGKYQRCQHRSRTSLPLIIPTSSRLSWHIKCVHCNLSIFTLYPLILLPSYFCVLLAFIFCLLLLPPASSANYLLSWCGFKLLVPKFVVCKLPTTMAVLASLANPPLPVTFGCASHSYLFLKLTTHDKLVCRVWNGHPVCLTPFPVQLCVVKMSRRLQPNLLNTGIWKQKKDLSEISETTC